ncbi:MAG: NAD(P)-binding protein [Acidobacteriota bacterium]
MSQKDDAKSWKALFPPMALSYESTLVNKTGSWKYIKPLYQDKTPPCNEGCPAGEDIEGYMYLISKGKIKEAWELLRKDNPFPAVCGRVCFHPCEMACNRKDFDEALSINQAERYLGDFGLEKGKAAKIKEKRNERVAIIGSGPAGLSCAYHLAVMGYRVTVFEALPMAGGILMVGIPQYRLPKDVLQKEIKLIEDMGVEIKTGMRVGKEIGFSELERFDATFIATGVHVSRKIGAKNEDVKGVLSGLDFLKELNLGKKPKVGKKVAIIGGGNTAMDAARSVLRMGSTPVVVYRRTRAEMPAIEDEIEEAEREGIEFIFLAAPIEVHTKGDKIVDMECIRMRLGEPDESGRRKPEPIKGSNFKVKVDNVISAIGEKADLSFLPEDIKVEDGVIVTDESLMTTRKGIFAGGDVIDQPHTVVDAIGSGKKAAIEIDRYIRNIDVDLEKFRIGEVGNISMERYLGQETVEKANHLNMVVRIDDLNLDYFEHQPRREKPRMPVEKAKKSFAEVNTGFSEEMVRKEASRCFNCAVCNECEICLIFCPDVAIIRKNEGKGFEFKYDYCKGCGICVHECPRNAMSMTREDL